MSMIKIENLSKEFTRKNETIKVLSNISTEFKKGERIAIIGPSGSGKSTFLRCLNLLEKPTSGKIFFEGKDILDPKCNINEIRRQIGMVFQNFNLFTHLTVLQNIILAPVNLKIFSVHEAKDIALGLLKKVGLETKCDAYPSELSGGQKQRIAIVRAIIMNPKVMLFDEPTSALDPEMVEEVTSVIMDIAKEGMTMIFVTHEMTFVKNLSTRVLFMDKGEIVFDNKPQFIFDDCSNERINKFLNKVSKEGK